ncbi:hypothetical protein TNCV_4247131 [Trichonephila clavipes]|nr:hypothetical protein TNCV_4247131 [Trichonephila clavipes]
MRHFTFAENADMHYMHSSANGNGRAALRMYHVHFPDERMPDYGIFQLLHRELHETRLLLVAKHDAGIRTALRTPSLEESLLNFVADRPESSTIAVAHHVSVSHQAVCRVLS